MRNRLLLSAAALASLIAVGHFGAKPLLAQLRAALVKNIDERGRTPYMVQSTCGMPGIAVQCEADFPVVPANKRFVVEYISGSVSGGRDNFQEALLNVPSAGQNRVRLLVHFDGTKSTGYQYTISVPVVFYYEPGQAPSVALIAESSPGVMGGTFTLSGYLVDLTQ